MTAIAAADRGHRAAPDVGDTRGRVARGNERQAAARMRVGQRDDDMPPEDALDFGRPGSGDDARDGDAYDRDAWPDGIPIIAGRPARPCDCERDDLLRVIARAPPLAAVVAAAQRAAGVARDEAPSWRRRSKLAALVPWLSVRAGNSESWRDVSDPTISHSYAFGASVAWRLERLVYDPNEPRFAAYAAGRQRERRVVAQLASRAYFAWVEAEAAALRDPRWVLQAYQAHADLDALTDGWFSQTTQSVAANRVQSR